MATIRRYSQGDWLLLHDFMERRWSADYPLLDRELFEWQFTGYGPLSTDGPSLFLAIDEEHRRLAGFIGLIPGVFKTDGDLPEKAGSFVAMWFVADEYQNGTIGLKLFVEASNNATPLASLGVNPLAQRFFRRAGFDLLDSLVHWVAPLSEQYHQLLLDSAPEEVTAWLEQLGKNSASPAVKIAVSPEKLADSWARLASGVPGLCRTRDYYKWRYKDSPGYLYTCLQSPHGLALLRIESPEALPGLTVVRVIEALPAAGSFLHDSTDSLAGLMMGVMAWGRQKQCSAIDFQVTPGYGDAGLERSGMRRRSVDSAETAIPTRLTPTRWDAPPINALYLQDGHQGRPWFFTKSDGDMDRPCQKRDNSDDE